MPNFINLMGQRFGRLKVLEYVGKTKRGLSKWKCLCDCGKEIVVVVNHLKNGHTRSCGCLKKDLAGQQTLKHGHSRVGKVSKIYMIWQAMNKRCNNPKDKSYKNYGKRKIKVCYRWSNKNPKGFQNFLKDVGEIPKRKDLDRTNNNRGYGPKNFRIVPRKENCRNKNNNHIIRYKGEKLCLTEMAEKYNIGRAILLYRLKMGWSIRRALTTPVRKHKKYKKRIKK